MNPGLVHRRLILYMRMPGVCACAYLTSVNQALSILQELQYPDMIYSIVQSLRWALMLLLIKKGKSKVTLFNEGNTWQ